MNLVEVIITFSNGEIMKIGNGSIIFPIKLTEHNGEMFTSKSKPVVLDEYFHPHDGFIPELTSVFAQNEFFTIDSEDTYRAKVYKSSSIVSLEQKDY